MVERPNPAPAVTSGGTNVQVTIPPAPVVPGEPAGRLLDANGCYHPTELRFSLVCAALRGGHDVDTIIDRLPDLMTAVDHEVVAFENDHAAPATAVPVSALPSELPVRQAKEFSEANRTEIQLRRQAGASIEGLAARFRTSPPVIREVCGEE